jgi:UDP-MurNAc hydroxylase
MKIQSLNNATTIINSAEDRIILDPWVVGDLYQNSWSPFPYFKNYKKYLKPISHILISHLHQDHFDPETLKLIDKKAKVIIPNLKFNSIMVKTLKELKFENINLLDLSCWHKISKNFSLYIIPPLNEMAQELEKYEKLSEANKSYIAIDTGFIINDHITNTNHIFLGDNSPYDLNLFKKHIGNLKYSSYWFPYNGFAGDYPLCYDSLSIKEKKKISLNMSLIREQSNIEAINLCKPEVTFPYSSDFSLHGKYKKDFFKVHDEEFFYKYKYAKRIKNLTKVRSIALYGDDFVKFSANGRVDCKLFSDQEQKTINKLTKTKIKFPQVLNDKPILEELNTSLKKMFERAEKFNLDTKKLHDWFLKIKTENNTYNLDFNNRIVHIDDKKKKVDKKILILKTNENIIRALIQKKLHFDNAQIGCYLSWERYPNIYEKSMYDCLIFFHL